MVAEFVAVAAGSMILASVATRTGETGRRRRLARDDRAGRPLVLPGAIIGTARYCHPRGGVLEVDGSSLSWLTGRGGLRYAVPAERLSVERVTDSHDPIAVTGRWVDVECSDGPDRVTVVLMRHDLQYLTRAVPDIPR